MRAQCLAQGKHSANVHRLSPILVGGAHSYPTPSPKPSGNQTDTSLLTHHLLPQCDIAFDRASRAQPWQQEVEVGKVIPKGRETKFPGGEYRWRERQVSAQGCLPPVGGSRGQRVAAWTATPRGELEVPGVCVPPRATGPQLS